MEVHVVRLDVCRALDTLNIGYNTIYKLHQTVTRDHQTSLFYMTLSYRLP